ncbi:MAG: MaoC family dehydratase [Candidatus Rokubacteria bacterium]|nr:MaoC family dehydratase [Candidatus Rokubacteria bacterium]
MSGNLPEYLVTARNTAAQSENAIHDDAVAQRYGFRGGLVPGVTVYAYLTRPLVEAWGRRWLEKGTASVRFSRPVLEGEEVHVRGHVTEQGPSGVTAALTVETEAGGECATATATLPAAPPDPPAADAWAVAALPAERPPATREHLAATGVLGTPVTHYDEAAAAEYLGKVSDALPVYRGPEGLVHPAYYLDQANRALDRNVRMGPWIHVGSVVRHLSLARVGERLETRGRVRGLFEKKEREFVEVDLLIVAGEAARPVAQVLHTAIYRLPAPPPG